MKYCVIKDTTTIIDGSDDSDEVMYRNALGSGFSEFEIEILAEEEYLLRLENEHKPQQQETQIEILQETVDALVISSLGV